MSDDLRGQVDALPKMWHLRRPASSNSDLEAYVQLEAVLAVLAERERLLADVIEYAQHDSWRCEYRERYKTCRCGLDDLMARLGLPPVAVNDPEANA